MQMEGVDISITENSTNPTRFQHPAAGIDAMGRDWFAGLSFVPAHVKMMGFVGMGNNPMMGATVTIAVAVEKGFERNADEAEMRNHKTFTCIS